MSNQTQHGETSQSAVRGGALQRGATIDFWYDTWWRWDLGSSALTQYADSDTNWTVEGFERFFVPYGHAALAEADVTTTPAQAAYSYLAQDHLGTGRFVYDQAKTQIAAVEHLPHGDRYAATGDAPYHEFTGKPWDEDAGLFYFPYRYYAPMIGRWISDDPLGIVDGPNVYGYIGMYFFPYRHYQPGASRWLTPDPLGMTDGPNVHGYVNCNPVMKVDPLGLWDWTIVKPCKPHDGRLCDIKCFPQYEAGCFRLESPWDSEFYVLLCLCSPCPPGPFYG